jgi:hypothetical protein
MLDMIHEVLDFPEGKLEIWLNRRTDRPVQELPDESYIWIWHLKAEPRGQFMLRRYSKEVMARIRAKLGESEQILLHPAANAQFGDTSSQSRLETYYLSCGFVWYHDTGFMIWPDSSVQ